jgi:hypothetical protein
VIETALNALWIVVAAGLLAAAPRSSVRVRIALFCALALLFPIISVSDDISSSATSLDDIAAVAVAMVVIAIVLQALLRLHVVAAPVYAIHFATPSDPRSPPR